MSPADDPKQPRQPLVDLEIKLAFLERTVETLNEVILEQGDSIDRLKARLGRLEARSRESEHGGAEKQADPLDERPPHY